MEVREQAFQLSRLLQANHSIKPYATCYVMRAVTSQDLFLRSILET